MSVTLGMMPARKHVPEGGRTTHLNMFVAFSDRNDWPAILGFRFGFTLGFNVRRRWRQDDLAEEPIFDLNNGWAKMVS